MRRLLILLFALVLPAELGAQVTPAETGEVIITGVVREQDVAYEPIGSIKGFGQSVSFVAWRQGEEPVDTTLLWVSITVETREEQAALQEPFREGRLVRFAVESPPSMRVVDGSLLFAEATWARMLEPVEDAELSAAAERILNPQPFEDPELGEFEPHSRLFDHFGQVREWLGQETILEVVLDSMDPTARERALAMAKLAWNDRAAIDETIRETVTDHIYSRRAEQAGIMLVPVDGGEPITEGELPNLSREAFKANHTLVSVSCAAQGYCVLEYISNGFEGDWSYRATITRDGDSWALDEWDFP